MTPDSAKGTPNSVASRGMAFSRKNMTTKVGAARISEMIETVMAVTTPPLSRPAASSRPSARPMTRAMAAISKLTTMPARNFGRKSFDSRSISPLMLRPADVRGSA